MQPAVCHPILLMFLLYVSFALSCGAENASGGRRLMIKFFNDNLIGAPGSGDASSAVVTVPSSSPITLNPRTTVTNPIGGVNNGGNPITAPLTAASAPLAPQGSWCVARNGVPEASLQAALDYACGMGGANCSNIQQGATCYSPNTLQSHASYAFNSYYQRNPHQGSCDFGGMAALTNVNPSSGSCIFATGPIIISPTPASPVTVNPTAATASSTGATTGGLGASPIYANASNPDQQGTPTPTGISQVPENADTSSASKSSHLQPVLGCMLVISTTAWGYSGILPSKY